MNELSKDWWHQVLRFWFEELAPDAWFGADAGFDEIIRRRFLDLYYRLTEVPADRLLAAPKTVLAAIIVFEQFSRNMFRGKAEATPPIRGLLPSPRGRSMPGSTSGWAMRSGNFSTCL